jgi:glycosyltransferase involved in cell wall biosynthesis
VVAEAMASGLPVIAYRSAAAAELIAQQKNGMVASPGDERAYVDGALWMLEESARLNDMAEAARQTMLPRSWAGVVETFENVAREAIGVRS